jgi:hypothetical protein
MNGVGRSHANHGQVSPTVAKLAVATQGAESARTSALRIKLDL